MIDPSFESDSPAWVSVAGLPRRSTAAAYTGVWSVYLGGRNYATDAFGQSIVVPSWADSAALYFATLMYSSDSTVLGYDKLAVGVGSSGVLLASAEIWNNGLRDQWVPWRWVPLTDIRPYRGGSLEILVAAYTDPTWATWWYVDKVEFWFACGFQVAGASNVDSASEVNEPASMAVQEQLREILRLYYDNRE